MKKRAKIITTIASLCLAVALMAFGVYAATTATLGITSKVKFEAVDVKVTWNWIVSGGTLAADITGNHTFNEEGSATESEAIVLLTGEDSDEDIEFARSAGNTITYKFTVHNDGLNSVDVTPSTSGADYYATATNVTVKYYGAATNGLTPTDTGASGANQLSGNWGAAGAVTVPTDGYYTWAVVLTLTNVTQDVAEQELDFSFSAVRHAA